VCRISETDELPQEKLSDWVIVRFIKLHRESVGFFFFATVVTLTCCVYYLATMLTISDPGLTLDDSWIHVQFARTIFEGTPWEYSPGVPSTGSTSPLWSIILSPIFFFTQEQFGIVWGVYMISIGFFTVSTYLVGRIVANYTSHFSVGLLSMLVFVIIPRNAWLMLSGMETPLFVFVLLLSIWMLDKEEMKYDLLLGVVAGIAFLSRPEGALVVLCIPIRLIMLAGRGKVTKQRFGLFILSGIFAVLVVSPWILHCISTTGYPLPDTFYAKVHTPTGVEIAAWDEWWVLFVNQMPYIPAAVFLGVVLIVKGKPFAWLLPVSLTVLYRLSTPYASLINNARYLVPIFDLFLVVAIASGAILFKLVLTTILEVKDQVSVNAPVVLILLIIFITPMFPHFVWQATNYGKAAGNINDMQVHIGKWLDENTPPDAIFAIHDAGALRFFSGRGIIDFAGLVTPDIIHSNMTNRDRMQYLYEHGCNYFVFFNELFIYWTHFIPSNAYSKLYTVFLEDNVVSGRDTMSVYQIFWEQTDFPALSV
jgi:hypothetical protein